MTDVAHLKIEVTLENDHQARNLTLVNDMLPILVTTAGIDAEQLDELAVLEGEALDGGNF